MRSNVPNVNASLIREIRMIAQQFFRHKDTEAFLGSRSQKPSIAVLKCAPCLRANRKKPHDAITIDNGRAVCEEHMIDWEEVLELADTMKKAGYSEPDIAKKLGITISEFRAMRHEARKAGSNR